LGGVVNGLLAAGTGINDFVVTLATAFAFTGVNVGLTKSTRFDKMPTALQNFGNGRVD
jgi:ribose transport system permease protein